MDDITELFILLFALSFVLAVVTLGLTAFDDHVV